MPNIKPISELRNYDEVLNGVEVGEPIFLTKNGRGRFAILDVREYNLIQAKLKLMSELYEGKKSGEQNGWLSLEEVERNLGIFDA